MKSKPIPIPRGGFTSNEDEARWLAGTIGMRASETLMAATGISSNWTTDSLYELLLEGLGAAARRARKEANQAHERRVTELLAANNVEVERRREAECSAELLRIEVSLLSAKVYEQSEANKALLLEIARLRRGGADPHRSVAGAQA